MNILITRYRHKPDTIDGHLSIDGIHICDCAENAHTALPPGTYSISIVHCRQYARKMPLITPISNQSSVISNQQSVISNQSSVISNQSSVINNRICPMLKPGNGIYNRKDGSILVGEYLVPGCLKHSRFTFDNLYDRLRKSIERGHPITLTIR